MSIGAGAAFSGVAGPAIIENFDLTQDQISWFGKCSSSSLPSILSSHPLPSGSSQPPDVRDPADLRAGRVPGRVAGPPVRHAAGLAALPGRLHLPGRRRGDRAALLRPGPVWRRGGARLQSGRGLLSTLL